MMRGCRMLSGVPPVFGSVERYGAIGTLLPSAVPSVSTGFAFSALNKFACARTWVPPNLKIRLIAKSSWFHRGSYLVPGVASLTVIAGSPAKRDGSTIAPGVQPGTAQSLGYRVAPRLIVQFKPPLSTAFVVAFGAPA